MVQGIGMAERTSAAPASWLPPGAAASGAAVPGCPARGGCQRRRRSPGCCCCAPGCDARSLQGRMIWHAVGSPGPITPHPPPQARPSLSTTKGGVNPPCRLAQALSKTYSCLILQGRRWEREGGGVEGGKLTRRASGLKVGLKRPPDTMGCTTSCSATEASRRLT